MKQQACYSYRYNLGYNLATTLNIKDMQVLALILWCLNEIGYLLVLAFTWKPV